MREACARRPFERLHDVSGNAEVGTPFRISISIYLRPKSMLSNEQIWSLTFCVGAGLGPRSFHIKYHISHRIFVFPGGVPGSLLPLTQVIPRLVM